MESHGHAMCIHVSAATRALLQDDGTGWADYGHRHIKGAPRQRGGCCCCCCGGGGGAGERTGARGERPRGGERVLKGGRGGDGRERKGDGVGKTKRKASKRGRTKEYGREREVT